MSISERAFPDRVPGALGARAALAAAVLVPALLVGAAAVVLVMDGVGVDRAAPMQAADARPRATVQPVSSSALPHVPGMRISAVVVDFPPNGFSPRHHHGGSVTVYVLAGAIRSQLEGEPAAVYGEGESFFEPPGVVHLLAENASATEPARILAIFVAEEGAALTTYHD